MRTSTATGGFIICAAAGASIAMAAAHAQNGALPPTRTFKPPRVAVLEVSRLFENYNKKKDREAVLKSESREEEKRYREMQSRLRAVLEELKNVENGSARHRELTMLSKGLEYDLKVLEQDLSRRFREKKLAALKEINLELSSDIERYATGLELDLVLEKTLVAEGENGTGIRFPIVHYARPEIDITDDLLLRLNARYGPRKSSDE
jgi:Skp family chaperone for outer membrane proteins